MTVASVTVYMIRNDAKQGLWDLIAVTRSNAISEDNFVQGGPGDQDT